MNKMQKLKLKLQKEKEKQKKLINQTINTITGNLLLLKLLIASGLTPLTPKCYTCQNITNLDLNKLKLQESELYQKYKSTSNKK